MKTFASIALFLVSGAPAFAQCINVAGGQADRTFTGVLEQLVFPGPPDWRDLKDGDRLLPTCILRLPRRICISDGGQFADPALMFDDIHVSSYGVSPPWDWLNAHVGLKITLTGKVFAAENALHKAPLVMMLPQGWKPPL